MTPQPTPPADPRPALSRAGELFALAAGTFADETADRHSYAAHGFTAAIRAALLLHPVDAQFPPGPQWNTSGGVTALNGVLQHAARHLGDALDSDLPDDVMDAVAVLVTAGRLHRQAMTDAGMTPAAAVSR